MKTLYLDTETTGLVDLHRLASDDVQPHLVQFGAVLVERARIDFERQTWREVAVFSAIVRPEGWTIPIAAEKVHGISTSAALAVGLPASFVLPAISNLLRAADEVVAHNLAFDDRVVDAAFHRLGRGAPPWPARRACTMEMAEPILRLPPSVRMKAAGISGYKRPSLLECFDWFFREKLVGAHDALVDTRACARVHRRICDGAARDGWLAAKIRGLR